MEERYFNFTSQLLSSMNETLKLRINRWCPVKLTVQLDLETSA